MFTEKFSEILQKRAIKPYHVAKGTGISPGLMSEYSNGVKLPTLGNLVKIADYLDCSVDYLLNRDNQAGEYSELVDLYASLPPQSQDVAMQMLSALAIQAKADAQKEKVS